MNDSLKKALINLSNAIKFLLLIELWISIIVYFYVNLFHFVYIEGIVMVFICTFIIVGIIAIIFPLIVHFIWKIGTNDFNEMIQLGKNKLLTIQSLITVVITVLVGCITIFKESDQIYLIIAPVVIVILLNFLLFNNNGVKLSIIKYI